MNEGEGIAATRIIGYPSKNIFYVKEKVVGISIGKYHSMCWSSEGSVYTWGNRSIALGYEDLP